MSVWRAEIDISFKLEKDLIAFLNFIETIDEKMVEPKTGNMHIKKQVRYHECKHDVGQACGPIVLFEFDGTEKFKKIDGTKVEPTDIISDELKDKLKPITL